MAIADRGRFVIHIDDDDGAGLPRASGRADFVCRCSIDRELGGKTASRAVTITPDAARNTRPTVGVPFGDLHSVGYSRRCRRAERVSVLILRRDQPIELPTDGPRFRPI